MTPQVESKAPQRRHMPAERSSLTRKFKINQEIVGGKTSCHKFWVTVSWHEDGMLGEVFVRMQGASQTTKSFVSGWCVMFSMAIQHGVPLDRIIDKFKGSHFEPSGETESEFGRASSIYDLIVRFIETKFPGGMHVETKKVA